VQRPAQAVQQGEQFIDQLALLGAEPVGERIVRDRNRITGAGVTSGIDFALVVVAELRGREMAEAIQLQIEYDLVMQMSSLLVVQKV